MNNTYILTKKKEINVRKIKIEKRPMDENEKNYIQGVGRHVTKFARFGGLMIFKSEKGFYFTHDNEKEAETRNDALEFEFSRSILITLYYVYNDYSALYRRMYMSASSKA